MSVPPSQPPQPSHTSSAAQEDPDRTLAADLSAYADASEPMPTVPANDAPPAASEWPVVPGYQILGVLGRGGMGVVYKARQVGLGRLVALKMILAGGHAGPEDMVRFLAEGEAVAQLQHTNIVQIYQVGRHGELPFFSLEYVDGGSLSQRLHGKPQPPRDAARLVEALARAMHLAHQKGVIHRDLKPSNILLAGPGKADSFPHEASGLPPLAECTPKITDFGLAKRVETGPGLTQTGAILGTPSYMAPEQAQGRKDVGPATDIYALGAIIYEMVTGRPPFRAPTSMETIFQVLAEEPVPPARLQPGVPRDLETICLKCLHKEPGKRYPSAEALADDLERFLTDRPILARRTGSLERLWRWRRRNPVLAGLTAAVALLLLLLAVGSMAAAFWFRHQRELAEESHQEAVANLDRALRAEDEGEEKLWHELMARARAGRFSQRAGQRFESLEALAQAARMSHDRHMPAERLERLRDLAIACLALPDIRVREWEGWPEGSVGLAFSAERGLYARTNEQGDVSVRRLDDDAEVARLAGAGVKVQPHFSPDGRVLLLRELEGGHAIRAWRPGEESHFAQVEETADVADVQVSPDAGRFAVAHKDGSVHLFALPSGRRTVLPGGPSFHQMRFSPQGRWLAVGRPGAVMLYDLAAETSRVLERGLNGWWLWFGPGDKQLAVLAGGYTHPEMRFVRVFDLESGRLATRLEHPDSVCSIAWHPDGKTLATGTFDSSLLTLWDVPTRSRLQTITSHKGSALQVGFNQTGDLLLSYSNWASGSRLWHPATGKPLLVSPEARFPGVQATSDGRLLALESTGHKLRLCEAHPGREYRTLVRDPAAAKEAVAQCLALHPEGRLLAAGLEEGVALWDLDSGLEVAFLPLGKTTGVCFDGTGALWTGSSTGLRRWPVQAEPGAAGQLRVGPPQTFPLPGSRGLISVSRDGRVAACPADMQRGAAVVHLDRPNEPVWLTPQYDVRGVSVSPDGRLVAAGNYFTDARSPEAAVKVWEADSGRLITTLPIAQGSFPYFSPDGRRLLIDVAGGQARLFDVETWQELLRIDGTNTTAFTPDSKLLTIETGTGVVRLADVRDGHTVVRLEDPGQARATPRVFSRDGTRLILGSSDDRAIHIWDLRALRRRLAALGLDWDANPYPPAPEAHPAGEPLRVSVDHGVGPRVASAPPAVMAPVRRRVAGEGDIAAWVKQLGDADAALRQKAADALAEVGPAAVKALSAVAEGPEGEQRRQARAVLDRIAVAEALAPSRVRLRCQDARPDDVLGTLAKQAHLPLTVAPGSAERRITLDFEDVPLWEALDRVCAEAGLALTFSRGELRTEPVGPMGGAAHGHAGPFHLEVISTASHRGTSFSGGKSQRFESVHVTVQLLKEPRTRLLALQQPRLTEARTEDGQSLLGPAPASYPVLVQEGLSPTSFFVFLKPPGRDAGKVAVLRGVLPVEVRARPRDLVVVTDLTRSQGRTFRGDEGHQLRLDLVRRNGTFWTVSVQLQGPPGWRYEPTRCGLEMVDARGRSLALGNVRLLPSAVQEPQPEDLAWLAAAPQALSLARLPWPALALQPARQGRTQWRATFQTSTPVGFEAPIKLRLVRFDRLRTEVPFELRDVPLP